MYGAVKRNQGSCRSVGQSRAGLAGPVPRRLRGTRTRSALGRMVQQTGAAITTISPPIPTGAPARPPPPPLLGGEDGHAPARLGGERRGRASLGLRWPEPAPAARSRGPARPVRPRQRRPTAGGAGRRSPVPRPGERGGGGWAEGGGWQLLPHMGGGGCRARSGIVR